MIRQVMVLRKVVGFKIDTSTHKELKHLAIDCGKDVSELAELAIRLLLELSATGIPQDLVINLQRKDPTLLNKLREVVGYGNHSCG